MKKLQSLTFLVFALLITACSSQLTKDIEVDSALDPKADLQGYKTYAWLAAGMLLNDPEGKWQAAKYDISSDIKFNIDKELRVRNIVEVPAQNADVAISFFTGVDMEAQGLKYDPKKEVEVPANVPKAALMVVAIDTETGFVIWVGMAKGDYREGSTVEETKIRIEYAIHKMFNK